MPDAVDAHVDVANCCELLAVAAPQREHELRRRAWEALAALQREERLPQNQRERFDALQAAFGGG